MAEESPPINLQVRGLTLNGLEVRRIERQLRRLARRLDNQQSQPSFDLRDSFNMQIDRRLKRSYGYRKSIWVPGMPRTRRPRPLINRYASPCRVSNANCLDGDIVSEGRRAMGSRVAGFPSVVA
jgi:hypothetical protein